MQHQRLTNSVSGKMSHVYWYERWTCYGVATSWWTLCASLPTGDLWWHFVALLEPLVVINGNLTARRCIDEVLQPGALPFFRNHVDVTLYQQDYARPHSFALLWNKFFPCREDLVSRGACALAQCDQILPCTDSQWCKASSGRQRILCSDCWDVQADLSLRWAHIQERTFLWLI